MRWADNGDKGGYAFIIFNSYINITIRMFRGFKTGMDDHIQVHLSRAEAMPAVLTTLCPPGGVLAFRCCAEILLTVLLA